MREVEGIALLRYSKYLHFSRATGVHPHRPGGGARFWWGPHAMGATLPSAVIVSSKSRRDVLKPSEKEVTRTGPSLGSEQK